MSESGGSKRTLFGVYRHKADMDYARTILSSIGIEGNSDLRSSEGENKSHFLFIDEGYMSNLKVDVPSPMDKLSTDYMLAVYNSSSADFRSSEELGDRRINLYITLATAVLGASVALATGQFVDSLPVLLMIIIIAVVALLGVGTFTFLRIIRRNLESDRYIRSMKNVGKYFILSNPRIKPFLAELDPFEEKRRRSETIGAHGGLLEMVAVFNSVIAAAAPLLVILALFVASTSEPGQSSPPVTVSALEYSLLVICAILLGFGAWFWQIQYAERRYQGEESITHSPRKQ